MLNGKTVGFFLTLKKSHKPETFVYVFLKTFDNFSYLTNITLSAINNLNTVEPR